MPDAQRTRSLAYKGRKCHCKHVETIRHSLRNGFTVYLVLLVSGLFSHRRLSSIIDKLDPSVGRRSGPHDFALRTRRARLAQPLRPSHPAPNVRDDWPKRPFLRERDAGR
jgi:hypothetical protein